MFVAAEDSTVTRSFNTTQFSTGAPFTLGGTPSMYARVDGSATEITTGFTLSADFDSKTGENQWALDLSASASYTPGSVVEVFVGAGTVDSVSVIAIKVYEFQIGTTGSLDAAITRTLTALPNAAPDAAGGIPISDAGGLDLDAKLANTHEITAARMGALTDLIDGGRLDLILDELTTQGDTNEAAIGALNDPSAAAIADAVWDETLSGHLGAGSTGEALNAAGAAGDPWTTALPGAYGAGSAGYIIGNNLNATVSSRASQTSVDTIDGIVDDILDDTGTSGVVVASGSKTGYSLSSTGMNSVVLPANIITASSIASNALTAAKAATDFIGSAQVSAAAVTKIQTGLATGIQSTLILGDTATIIGTQSSHTTMLNDIPTVAEFNARTLTSASYATAAAIAALNNLSQAQAQAAAEAGLAVYDGPTRAELTTDINSVLAKLLAYVQLLARKDAGIATDNATELTAINANEGSGAGAYDNTRESQEAIRDRGDAAWTSGGGGGGATNITTEEINIVSDNE